MHRSIVLWYTVPRYRMVIGTTANSLLSQSSQPRQYFAGTNFPLGIILSVQPSCCESVAGLSSEWLVNSA